MCKNLKLYYQHFPQKSSDFIFTKNVNNFSALCTVLYGGVFSNFFFTKIIFSNKHVVQKKIVTKKANKLLNSVVKFLFFSKHLSSKFSPNTPRIVFCFFDLESQHKIQQMIQQKNLHRNLHRNQQWNLHMNHHLIQQVTQHMGQQENQLQSQYKVTDFFSFFFLEKVKIILTIGLYSYCWHSTVKFF